MKKLMYAFLLLTINQIASAQTDVSKVTLGIPILAKSTSVADDSRYELSGVLQDQAGKIKDLKLVPRSDEALKTISNELIKATDPSAINSAVAVDQDKQSSATYMLVGFISKVDLTKTLMNPNNPIPLYAKFVNIQISLSIINVSNGQLDTTAEISSDNLPVPNVIGGDSRTLSKAFNLMGKKFNVFIQNWYNNKNATVKTNN